MRQRKLNFGKLGTKFRIIFPAIIILAVIIPGFFFLWKNHRLDLQNKASAQISEYIVAKMSDCQKISSSSGCYKANAVDFLNHFKLSEIMTVFEKNEKTPVFFSQCHATAHFLGQEAYKKYGGIPAVFEQANHSCLGGVYHGAVEGYFMARGVTDIKDPEIKKEIEHICGTAKDYADPQKFIECNHGLGHATMYLAENDLPQALDMCEALQNKREQDLCFTGALMANADSFGSSDHPTKYIKEDDPLYPCPILKKNQQEMCYTYGALTRSQSDLPKSIEVCGSVPTEFRHECFETIGRDRTILSSDPSELKSQCNQIKQDEYRIDCISGTAYNLVIRFGANSDIPTNYCAITDEKFKSNCYLRIFTALRQLTKNTEIIKKFCGRVSDDKYKNQCENSA